MDIMDKKCKDCSAFQYADSMPEALSFCNGHCYNATPPWEPLPVNSEWDMVDCPFVHDYIEEQEDAYHREVYEQLRLSGDIPNE